MAGRDVTACGRPDQDVRAGDLRGLEQPLEVADQLLQTARTRMGPFAKVRAVVDTRSRDFGDARLGKRVGVARVLVASLHDHRR